MTQPPPPNRPAASAAPQAVQGLRAGDKLDKYDIVAQIGAGGMSTVWKGHDRLLDRVVAIKELALGAIEGDEQEVRQRFRSEAQLQKRLAAGDKHLVKVIDFIDDPARGLFIVMEFIDGYSLEQMLTKNPAPMDRRKALGIMGATAMALESIHKQNVIHRDLKPSNILLPREGGLKVADFGIAAAVSEQNVMALGSVRYMAPELFSEHPVDARADIYSLGMIAYEMLAGRTKFNEAFRVVLRDVRNQPLRWMKWHTNPRAKAPPLSELNPKVPQTLSDLVGRMMEKDVNLRVASAAELLSSMRRHFADESPEPGRSQAEPVEPAAAPVQPSSNPTAALPKRGRLMYVLAAVLIVQFIGLGGFLLYKNSLANNAVLAERKKISVALTHAAQTYQADKFDDSLAEYTKIADEPKPAADDAKAGKWGDDAEFSPFIKTGVLLSQGRIDLRDALKDRDSTAEQINARLDKAIGEFNQADDLHKSNHGQIADLIAEARNRRAFNTEIKVIQDMIASGSDPGEVVKRLALEKAHSDYEESVLKDLNVQAQGLQSQAFDNSIIEDAKKIRDSKGLSAGIKELTLQLKSRPSNRVQEVLDKWQHQASYNDMTDQAGVAERTGKYQSALKLRTDAQKELQNDDNDKKITWLHGQVALDAAQKAEKDNRLAEARALYVEVLGYIPGNNEATQALVRIKTANQLDDLLKIAEDALGKGEMPKAIEALTEAQSLDPGNKLVQDKLVKTVVRVNVEIGNKLVDQSKFAEARKALDEARQRAPEDPTVKALDKRLSSAEDYQTHLTAGNDFLAKSDYNQAKKEFLAAQKALPTEEVKHLVQETEYYQTIADVHVYLSMKTPNYMAAWALLQVVMRDHPTPEAQKLVDEVQPHVPGTANGTR